MINFVDEIIDLLKPYNLNLNDVIFVVKGNAVQKDEFLEKFAIDYNMIGDSASLKMFSWLLTIIPGLSGQAMTDVRSSYLRLILF